MTYYLFLFYLICTGNQLTGFYMRATLALKGLRLSALIFTENKLVHWCFAKVRIYLLLKRLVKVLKFRISCFEVTHLKAVASDSYC